VIACAFCGRHNQEDARFCMDCGKSLTPSAAAILSPEAVQSAAESLKARRESARRAGAVPCSRCGAAIDSSLPYCAHCGAKTEAGVRAAQGAAARGDTSVLSADNRESGPRLVLLDDSGVIKEAFTLSRGEAIVGRSDGEIQFADDVYLSPVHAQFSVRDGQLWVRDLGSRNGTWVFLDTPHRMADGDVVLVGSQLLRFKRLGYPGPQPPEADKTRRLGSLTPTADIAMLSQLRADGSVRDTFHLSPGRNITIGREKGDWLFPYDQTMSATHAEVRSEDSDFAVADAGSRNGIAVAVRGERIIRLGQRVLLGDRMLRVEQL